MIVNNFFVFFFRITAKFKLICVVFFSLIFAVNELTLCFNNNNYMISNRIIKLYYVVLTVEMCKVIVFYILLTITIGFSYSHLLRTLLF